jgi:UDP-N-acetyl-2-amino-2-deoxyglucuronate dehydrogenase
MTESLRFGLVGCGVIGATHADAIAGLPDAELVAVADIDMARAATLAARYDASAHGSIEEMLDAASSPRGAPYSGRPLDVVTICTPSGLHGAQACQVMRAGCHVLVEKPMDIRREALDEMLAVQREAGVQLAVVSQHRFDPASVRMHELVAAGAFGRLVLGNAAVPWWRSQEYYDSADWRGTRALDGGVLMNQAIHSIDVLQWLMGPVRSVYAYMDTLAHRMESEDVAVAVLRFASGALGTISATTGGYPGDLTRIEVFGDKGSAVIENNELAYLRVAGGEQPPVDTPSTNRGAVANPGGATAPMPPPGSHAWQIADLIHAIREGRPPAIDGLEGRRPVDIILAIYESAQNGREVLLP